MWAPRLRTDAGLEPIAANREAVAVDLNLGRRATRRGSGRDGAGRSDSRQGEHQKNELLAHDSPPSRETGLPATGRPLSSLYPTPVALAQVQRETGRRRSSSCSSGFLARSEDRSSPAGSSPGRRGCAQGESSGASPQGFVHRADAPEMSPRHPGVVPDDGTS